MLNTSDTAKRIWLATAMGERAQGARLFVHWRAWWGESVAGGPRCRRIAVARHRLCNPCEVRAVMCG